MLDELNSGFQISSDEGSWFVYLLRSADCSTFKVGFSCHPLQRLYSFSHRYFDRFDLYESRLLRADTCDQAREIEAAIKVELAEQRTECPSWVSVQAGGATEWFSAVYFQEAEARFLSYAASDASGRILNAEDFVREELLRVRAAFELWAAANAQSASAARSAHERLRAAAELRSVRDWLDAYRALHIDVFIEDSKAGAFVSQLCRG